MKDSRAAWLASGESDDSRPLPSLTTLLREAWESGFEDADDGPAPGFRIGRYEVLRELGRGGMAVVLAARDTQLDRTVAIKMLHGVHDQQTLMLFRRETQATARLHHPCIVRLFDVGEEIGRPYCVMEWIDGPTLEQALAGRRVTRPQAIRAIQEAAEGVAHAHAHGVLHRDLKPRNILLTPDLHSVVIDFGLARFQGGPDPRTSIAGVMIGTPAYMSPEQALGEHRRIDERTDVWGLGATLYEVVTGQPPFGGGTFEQVFTRITREDPMPPRLLDSSVDPDLEAICMKALEKNPDLRYGSARDFADDLARFLDGRPVRARRHGWILRLFNELKRHRAEIVAALASAAATAALVLLLGHREHAPRAASLPSPEDVGVAVVHLERQAVERGGVHPAALAGPAVDRFPRTGLATGVDVLMVDDGLLHGAVPPEPPGPGGPVELEHRE